MSFKNNLRIILGSISENFKNIEAQQKFRYSYEKSKYDTIFRFARSMLMKIVHIFCIILKIEKVFFLCEGIFRLSSHEALNDETVSNRSRRSLHHR